MNNEEKTHCIHCGAELAQDEIAAKKCLRCMKPQESVPSPPPPPPPGTTFAAPHSTDKSFQWHKSSQGNLAVVGMVIFCIAVAWLIATVWINADILASAYDDNLSAYDGNPWNVGAALEKKQATTDFVDWTVIVLAGVALILGVCAYVKNSSQQKLAVVTMLLSAGLFFALFCFKIREYTWKKSNNAIQEKILQQPPPEIDFGDFD